MIYNDNKFYKHLNRARTVFYLVVLTIFCAGVGFIGSAVAQDKSFVVEDVRIDVTADNAVEAREQAFEVAQVKAYETLAARFLDAEQIKEFETPSLSEISNLVQNFEVTNEKISSVRYSGTYKIAFRPHSFKGVIQPKSASNSNAPIQSSPSKSLIFPVIQKDGQNFIWANGSYRDAWISLAQNNIRLIVPAGDAQDRSAIGDSDALSYDYNQLSTIIDRYGADKAYMVVSNPQASSDGAPAVQVKIYEAKPSGPLFQRQMMVPIYAGEMPDALFSRVASQSQIALEPLLAKGNTQIAKKPAPAKNDTMTGPAEVISAQLSFSSMREWVALKRNIEKTRGISSLTVKSMSAQNALVDIGYRGDLTMLSNNLRQQQLMLQSPIGNQSNGRATIYQLTKTR